MRGITKRIAWVIIVLSFAAFGGLLLFIGFGNNPFGLNIFQESHQEFYKIFGNLVLIITAILGLVCSLFNRMDSVDIPIKKISYVQTQNKAIYIVDGKVFEKISIEWVNIYLKNVRRRVNRNFYYIVLEDEIYISKPNDLNTQLESEENLIAREQTIEIDENPEESFKMSREDQNG